MKNAENLKYSSDLWCTIVCARTVLISVVKHSTFWEHHYRLIRLSLALSKRQLKYVQFSANVLELLTSQLNCTQTFGSETKKKQEQPSVTSCHVSSFNLIDQNDSGRTVLSEKWKCKHLQIAQEWDGVANFQHGCKSLNSFHVLNKPKFEVSNNQHCSWNYWFLGNGETENKCWRSANHDKVLWLSVNRCFPTSVIALSWPAYRR